MSTFIGSLPERKKVCKVTFTNWDKTVECKPHTNLRQLAIENDIGLYNGISRFANCEGNGLCGTCTVEVVPQDGLTGKGARENLRFLLLKGNLRFACQVGVTGDIQVTKHAGLKGNRGYVPGIDRAEVVRLYRDEGRTIAAIAKQKQCSEARVVTLLERGRVELRRPGSAA